MLDIPKQYQLKHQINRYPTTQNKSLKAWSASDELMLWYIEQNHIKQQSKLIINDSFGCLTVHLSQPNTYNICNLKSQLNAIKNNLNINQISYNTKQFLTPLSLPPQKVEVALIKIPKSIELFELYLQQTHQSINNNGIIICGFMTKHFTPQLIKIASKYFSTILQTKAWKKSRLMVLSNPIKTNYPSQIRLIKSKYGIFSQYKGVFSSNHIDYATQFLIENISIPPYAQTILDLASGNGILAKVVSQKIPKAHIHLVDDSFLAIESSKLNLKEKQFSFYHHYNLKPFSNHYFDYIISNPPFHLEHHIDLSLPTSLFTEAQRTLKPNGIFELVANRHLNYYPILKRLFTQVNVKAQNSKFMVYRCVN